MINLGEESPNLIERLLDFLYTLGYSDDRDDYDSPESAASLSARPGHKKAASLVINAWMYTLGDRYAIPSLKDLAKHRFATDLETGWEFTDFAELVSVIYETTPESDRALRDCMMATCREHGSELLEFPETKEAIKKNGDFALDFALATVNEKF